MLNIPYINPLCPCYDGARSGYQPILCFKDDTLWTRRHHVFRDWVEHERALGAPLPPPARRRRLPRRMRSLLE